MSKIEIRFGRRLIIRAAGRFAVAIVVLGLLAAVFIVADRIERGDSVQMVWRKGAPN
ncbi:MAG: hypothetical protein V7704_22400 [Aurantimonas endophytica]|uniref:hypothetical protein n=1 Tax=Aurantimonas endophytica TaxID=1522175 RepID=UPI00300395E9